MRYADWMAGGYLALQGAAILGSGAWPELSIHLDRFSVELGAGLAHSFGTELTYELLEALGIFGDVVSVARLLWSAVKWVRDKRASRNSLAHGRRDSNEQHPPSGEVQTSPGQQ